MSKNTSSIAQSIHGIRRKISTLEHRHARNPGSVHLLAVSKRKPVSAIREAMAAGQRAFGENYVDEAVAKIHAIDDPDLEWHFIGAIQSRKCASIAQYFQWAHGVDRLKVASRLSAQRPQDMPALNICLQVNLDNESGKAGVPINEVPALMQACLPLERIRIRGLMAIPAPRVTLEDQRHVFTQLHQCFSSLQVDYPEIDTLSMGMSGDMEAAVAEGATIVRIGTAIFGIRES